MKKQTHAIPFSLSLVTFMLYLPTLSYPFQFDDLANITKNFDLRSFNVFRRIFTSRRWFGEWINSLIFHYDGFNTTLYRLCNVATHILGGALVFYFILFLCKRMQKTSFMATYATHIASLTSMLFLLHPVQTQTVSYAIQGKLEGIASVLMLASLFAMLTAMTTKTSVIKQSSLLLFAALTILIACGTKEIAIVTPALLLVTDWFFLAHQSWHSLKTRLAYHLSYSGLVGTTMLYYFKPQFFLNLITFNTAVLQNRGNLLTSSSLAKITPLHFFISQFKVLVHYLTIFLWPFGMSVEYDWQLSPSFFSFESFAPFLFLTALVGFALWKTTRAKLPAVSFGIIWFFIAMAPRASIIPSAELACDYKTYLASIGWLFIIATGLLKLALIITQSITTQQRKALLSCAASFVFLLGTGTYNRNHVWSSGERFWKDIVEKAPQKARGHNNYGVEMVKHANTLMVNPETKEEARTLYRASIEEYKQAIRLDNLYPDPYSNLSVCFALLDKKDDAIAVAKQALKIFPEYPEAYNNLGSLCIQANRLEEAEEALKNAVRIRPHYGKAYYNLAHLYNKQGDLDKTWHALKSASLGDFDTEAECFFTLGDMSIKTARYDEAVQALNRYFSLRKDKDELYLRARFSLANAHHLRKDYGQARALYEELVRIQPDNVTYLHNLAETWVEEKDYEQAVELFKKATSKKRQMLQSHIRMAHCYEQLEKYELAEDVFTKLLDSADTQQLPTHIKLACNNERERLKLQIKLNNQKGTLTLHDIAHVA